MNKIYANRIQTPDGTIMQSFNRHDYKEYTDTITGEIYMIDGGTDYIRMSINTVPPTMLTVYESDPHPVKRTIPVWGTYGKLGDQPLEYISVAEMELDHILAILDLPYTPESFKATLYAELDYRRT